MIYSTGQTNVCTDFTGSELTKLENMQQLYILFDVTSTQNGTSSVMGTTTLLIGMLTRNMLKSTRSLYDFRLKSYGSNSGFRVVLKNAIFFIMGYLVAMEIRVTLFLLVQFCICYIV